MTERCRNYTNTLMNDVYESSVSSCPAYYDCRGTSTCATEDKFCDGRRDCEHGDDENEIRCAPACPQGCSCNGIKVKCVGLSFPDIPLFIPHIDVSSSIVNISDICEQYRTLLIYLNLARTGLDDIRCLAEKLLFPALHTFDLSENNIAVVPELYLPRLSILYLQDNPIILIETKLTFGELYLSHSDIMDVELLKTSRADHPIYSFHQYNTNDTCAVCALNSNCSLRFLDLSMNKLARFEHFHHCSSLLKLHLQHNAIDTLTFHSFNGMLKLQELYLQHNALSFLSNFMFLDLDKLDTLRLEHNEIVDIEGNAFRDLHSLKTLDLSNNAIADISFDIFKTNDKITTLDLQNNRISRLSRTTAALGSLLYLNMRKNKLKNIPVDLFKTLHNLRSLDLRNNKIIAHGDMFTGLGLLENLYVDRFTICCFRPRSVSSKDCVAPLDIFSSCSNLINVGFLHICIWFTAILSITGNILALANRIRNDTWIRESRDILVTNLCISDLLMGMYLLIVAFKDVETRGRYGYSHDTWLESATCKLAGTLVTTSSEMSTFCILAITIDRYILFKHPLSPRLKARKYSIFAVMLMWGISLIVSILPLFLVDLFGDDFYGRSSVCVSLPLTSITLKFKASNYSVALFIVVNLIIYCFVVAGQVAIFLQIRSYSSCIQDQKKKQREIAVAKSLSYVVISDTLCWLPIAILGEIFKKKCKMI